MKKLNLNEEERDILESYERGEWKSVDVHREKTEERHKAIEELLLFRKGKYAGSIIKKMVEEGQR